MKELVIKSPTYGIFVFLVSSRDFARINKYQWSLSVIKSKNHQYYYAASTVDGKCVRLHQFIMSTIGYKGLVVDHINGNTLDNTRQNLRVVSASQNISNQILSINSSTGLYNVYPNKDGSKPYRVSISVKGKRKSIGRYYSRDEAIRVANMVRRMYYGPVSMLNASI